MSPRRRRQRVKQARHRRLTSLESAYRFSFCWELEKTTIEWREPNLAARRPHRRHEPCRQRPSRPQVLCSRCDIPFSVGAWANENSPRWVPVPSGGCAEHGCGGRRARRDCVIPLERTVPANNSVLVRYIELADGEPVGSGRDDVCADFRSRGAPRLDPVTCRAAPRGPRTPASTAGTATVTTSTTAPGESGPVALGVAVMRVGRLANGRRDREAGNRRRLASPGLPLVLDMEKSPPPRTTARRRRCPRPDSDDVRAQPAVGSTTHSR